VDWLHYSHFFLLDPLVCFPVQYTVANTFAGVAAGILEEVVVLGYLVRRLEQRGMNPTAIVVIAVLIRVSYHLYYGWGAVPIAL
jgi:membrane protease YdiL (CAAX protease family)